jgi:Na+/H+ antiporter NhaA
VASIIITIFYSFKLLLLVIDLKHLKQSMKTVILFLLVFAIIPAAFPQIKRGQFLLGGSAHFESTKSDGTINPSYKTRDFFVSPNIGYFIIDKMGAGIGVDFASYKTTTDNTETKNLATTISPFLRYYVLPVPNKVNAFIEVSYVHEKTKWSSLTNSGYYEKAKGYYISAGPSIFLTSQIALEFTLGYQRTISDNFDNTVKSKLISGLGLQIHPGKFRNKSKK